MNESLADLHRHLDGSLRRQTAIELAEKYGIKLPQPMNFVPGMGLQEALSLFSFTTRILSGPDEIKRVAQEICEDATTEGIGTLEIRFAPQLHKGAPIEEVIDAALDGIGGRAGLILCGLYGEAPSTLLSLVEAAAERTGIVGIDLAGGPLPSHRFSLPDYAPAFARARDLGLGRTVHAGEGRPPDEIRDAIEVLHAQRISHGTTLLDDAEVARLVLENEVLIEACPTSNVHTNVIESVEEHPLREWLDRGIRVCVCTDNTLFSRVTIQSELDKCMRIPGITPKHRNQIIDFGHQGAFPSR